MNDTLVLTCPGCGSLNRVQTERIQKTPSCGRCGQDLFPINAPDVHEINLARMIQHDQLPLVIDFWSSTCGPCRMMAPAFAQAAAILTPQVRLARLLTDQNTNAAIAHQIQAVPTMILFDKGLEKARVSGAMSTQQIVNWVRTHIA